jgi:selenocysteine lyase/cysteine desulfurase
VDAGGAAHDRGAVPLREGGALPYYAREALSRTPWIPREPVAEPSGITTLVGGDPFATRAALLEQGVLVSAVPAGRSPDLTEPVLRVSTGPWVTEADLDRLADALVSLG